MALQDLTPGLVRPGQVWPDVEGAPLGCTVRSIAVGLWHDWTAVGGLERLSARDVEVVRECLTAAVQGPFFPEWEFHALIGLERSEVAGVLDSWPDSKTSEERDLAVNNVLNNLLGYPHDEWRAWKNYISAQPAEVASVLTRWRGDKEFDPKARGYVDRLL